MSRDQKYRMFRQYMANELGIGRDDIEYWVRDVAEREIKKILGTKPNLPEQCMMKMLRTGSFGYKPWDRLRDEIVRAVARRLKISCEITQPEIKQPEGRIPL